MQEVKFLKKGTELSLEKVEIGETVRNFLEVNERGNLQFIEDVYCQILRRKDVTIYVQAREIRKKKLVSNNIKRWGRLRRALHELGEETINVSYGQNPLHYTDELVIKAFSVLDKESFFIVPYSDVGKYLEYLPLDKVARRKNRAQMYLREKVSRNLI